MVEAVAESLKQRNFIPSLDLVEEAINSCDSLALVVSPQNNNLLREPHFQSEKQADYLARLFSSIDVVSHKEES